jgi:hypothetical protein
MFEVKSEFIRDTTLDRGIRGRPHEITLGGAEIRYVHIVVDLKVNYDRECRKVIEPKYGGKSRRRMLNFTGAELAFAKMFNIYMDFGRRFRSYDVVLPDGRTVDVKHTDQDQGRLVASMETSKRQIPNLFALMVGEFPSFEFRGAIPGKIFIQECNIKDLGHGPCYAIDQSRLSLDMDW